MRDRYLLLLARAHDPSVRALRQQAGSRLVHASIAELSRPGWLYAGGSPERATACAGGRRIEAAQIAAVLCRIAHVTPTDLPTLHPEDREYAAAEMTAFLRAWLAQFEGRVINEPTWMSLAGPAWHPMHWTRLVSKLGIPVTLAAGATDQLMTATVAGTEVLGVQDPSLIEYSRLIALHVKSRSLGLRFLHDGEWRFHSADCRPALDQKCAAALVREVFGSGGPTRAFTPHGWAGASIS